MQKRMNEAGSYKSIGRTYYDVCAIHFVLAVGWSTDKTTGEIKMKWNVWRGWELCGNNCFSLSLLSLSLSVLEIQRPFKPIAQWIRQWLRPVNSVVKYNGHGQSVSIWSEHPDSAEHCISAFVSLFVIWCRFIYAKRIINDLIYEYIAAQQNIDGEFLLQSMVRGRIFNLFHHFMHRHRHSHTVTASITLSASSASSTSSPLSLLLFINAESTSCSLHLPLLLLRFFLFFVFRLIVNWCCGAISLYNVLHADFYQKIFCVNEFLTGFSLFIKTEPMGASRLNRAPIPCFCVFVEEKYWFFRTDKWILYTKYIKI